MKYHKKRRFGALVLALAMALSLAAPGWAVSAADGTSLQLSQTSLNLKAGDAAVTLEATLNPEPTKLVTYTWVATKDGNQFTPNGEYEGTTNTDGDKFTIEPKAAVANVTITVTASWTDDAGATQTADAQCMLTITQATTPTIPPTDNPDPSPGPTVPVSNITLNQTALDLKIGQSETLTATVKPDDATNKTVTWKSSSEKIAKVDKDGKVTGVGKGTADITATAGGKTATCKVTVEPGDASSIMFESKPIVWTTAQTNPWTVSVFPSPAGSNMPGTSYVKWSVSNEDTTMNKEEFLPVLTPRGNGLTVTVNNKYPGNYTFSATYMKNGTEGDDGKFTGGEAVGNPVLKSVTISGITLNKREHKMTIGDSFALVVDKTFGAATGGTVRDIVWTSSDPSVVTVLNGDLMAWNTGTVIITANKNGYTAECKVTVGEDEAAIAGPYYATTGNPLIFKNGPQTFNGQTFNVYQDLNNISLKKSAKELDKEGNPDTSTGSPLRYITNVSVPTSQGTMYYNYNSEANTGEGVGMTDTFRDASVSDGSVSHTLDLLYFVPRQGFTGTAEITFTGRAMDGTIFSGIIRVEVIGLNYISYRTNAGEPVNFLSGDFNSFCRAKLGRDVNYVTFNLPQASQGTLYYNYTASGQYGDRVTTTTQYSRSGRYLIDDVSFVPNAAFVGEAVISFRGVDTAGNAFTGEVVISVFPGSASTDTSNVYISGERGKPVVLQSNLFNDACQATIRDTLSYVIFKLPDYSDGALFYNYRSANDYDSRVTATTRYYYSGVPGINGVSFVPASNNTGRVAIPFTGYGTGGTTFTGTLYITIGDSERSTVRYFVPKNGSINFYGNDFNNACLLQLGVGLDYVKFQLPEIDSKVGELAYDIYGSSGYNTGVYSNFAYYRNPEETYQGRIGLITFRAGSTAGTVTIPYTAYSITTGAGSEPKTYQGYLVIQVGSPTPEEVSLACKNAGQAWLSTYKLSNVCSPVMSGNLSYIEITGIPDASKGRMYYGYTGFGTGTEVKQGDRFYCLGGPNIDQVCFVPHSGFTGKAEITYVGVSNSGQEQLSGRIFVDVSQTTKSQYFNDLDKYVWAIDAVDYLRQNHAVQGVGGGRYNPQGRITKGDFTLMLVRAFGFTASGTVNFKDVPADSYYAEAIRIAAILGFGSSSNGYYYPDRALSRQDAMVMIRNALVADGWEINNGLAANLDCYHDEKQIASYARSAVGSLVQMGIVKGDGNGYLRPTALLNRAETAMLLHTLMTL